MSQIDNLYRRFVNILAAYSESSGQFEKKSVSKEEGDWILMVHFIIKQMSSDLSICKRRYFKINKQPKFLINDWYFRLSQIS